MFDDFTASNGWRINKYGDLIHPNGKFFSDWEELETFFAERRDHELGRWRDPEVTDLVCYPTENGASVRIISEESGESWVFCRYDDLGDTAVEQFARRYFDAHPLPKPLPTEKGLYVHAADVREFPHETSVLVLDHKGWYLYGEPKTDAVSVAQAWYDAGELVRLVPEFE